MKRSICVVLAIVLLCAPLFGCTGPDTSSLGQPPKQQTGAEPRDHSRDLSWGKAFRNANLPEGTFSPDEIAFYTEDKKGKVNIVNVPKEEISAFAEAQEALPRSRFFEQFMPENLASLYPALDYAMANGYCRFSIPTTEFNGQDVNFASQYLRLTYRINNSGISALSVTGFDLPDGDRLDYVLVTIPGMDSRGRMDQYLQAMTKAREIVAEVPEGTGEYERALYLYQWLTDNVRYDSNDYYESDWTLLYDTLVKKNTVCAGYAEALYVLFNLAGIECFTVGGYLNTPGGNGYHIWNVARIDGTYYQFDATWDEGCDPAWYRFFGVSDERLQSYYPRHIEALAEEYCPPCTENLPLPGGEEGDGRPDDLAAGTVENDTYIQRFMGLCLPLDTGLTVLSREAIGNRFYGTETFSKMTVEELLAAHVAYVDVAAENEDMSIYTLLERTPIEGMTIRAVSTPAEYMDACAKSLPKMYQATGVPVSEKERFQQTLCGMTWECFRYTAVPEGGPVTQTILCTEKEGILFSIYLTCYGADESDSIFSRLALYDG